MRMFRKLVIVTFVLLFAVSNPLNMDTLIASGVAEASCVGNDPECKSDDDDEAGGNSAIGILSWWRALFG